MSCPHNPRRRFLRCALWTYMSSWSLLLAVGGLVTDQTAVLFPFAAAFLLCGLAALREAA